MKWIIALLLAGCLVSAPAKTTLITSLPLTAEIGIDGADQELSKNLVFLEKEQLLIGCRHSASTLYIMLISQDQSLERQMLINGFTLWLNDNGKTKKSLGLRFPGMRSESSRPGNAQSFAPEEKRQTANDFSAELQNKLKIPPVFVYLTQNKDKESPYSFDELGGFQFARDYSEEGIIYEFAIPLQRGSEQIFGFLPQLDKPLSFAIECRSPQRDKQQSFSFPSDREPPQGRQGGGGGHGDPPSGEMPPRTQQQSRDYLYWFKIEMTE